MQVHLQKCARARVYVHVYMKARVRVHVHVQVQVQAQVQVQVQVRQQVLPQSRRTWSLGERSGGGAAPRSSSSGICYLQVPNHGWVQQVTQRDQIVRII